MTVCESDIAYVVLNSTRIESYLRAMLVGSKKKQAVRSSGLAALAKEFALDFKTRTALQSIATIRNRFCHQSPKFLNLQEKERFIANVEFIHERFQLNEDKRKRPRVIVDLTHTNEDDIIDLIDDEDEVVNLID